MYTSPIEVIYGDIETKFEDCMLKVIQDCGIRVNKDELIKALGYDRDQYAKGYEDGYYEGLKRALREEMTMKRYEKMSKEEIIEVFKGNDGKRACATCPCNETKYCTLSLTCNESLASWLNSEAPPRVATINTLEELEKTRDEYLYFCSKVSCNKCKYAKSEDNKNSCFYNYIAEEI